MNWKQYGFTYNKIIKVKSVPKVSPDGAPNNLIDDMEMDDYLENKSPINEEFQNNADLQHANGDAEQSAPLKKNW